MTKLAECELMRYQSVANKYSCGVVGEWRENEL
jgi:hypothetical protein